jgi:hypothetical protein
MLTLTGWNVLGVISLLCLFLSMFFDGILIWDGLIVGVAVCSILAVLNYLREGVINWTTIKDTLIIFILIGASLEITGRIIQKIL